MLDKLDKGFITYVKAVSHSLCLMEFLIFGGLINSNSAAGSLL